VDLKAKPWDDYLVWGSSEHNATDTAKKKRRVTEVTRRL
jgi:hypothetical protein